jgi:threonyl-tRNA synthetase
MKKSGLPFMEVAGEAAFYGPKVDFQIKSVIGREETASTNQLDFLAAQRFGLTYKDKDGKDKPVYVIHRAPLGSHERFIAFLIEHYAGDFPLWLAPEQVRIIPISEKVQTYGETLLKKLQSQNIRATIDSSNETLGKRIRNAELMKIPYMVIVGEEEEKTNTVSVRARSGGQEKSVALQKFIAQLTGEIEKKK